MPSTSDLIDDKVGSDAHARQITHVGVNDEPERPRQRNLVLQDTTQPRIFRCDEARQDAESVACDRHVVLREEVRACDRRLEVLGNKRYVVQLRGIKQFADIADPADGYAGRIASSDHRGARELLHPYACASRACRAPNPNRAANAVGDRPARATGSAWTTGRSFVKSWWWRWRENY